MRLIDADALFKNICDSINEMTKIGVMVDGEWLWAKLNDALENAPTIEPGRKKGYWQHDHYNLFICSNCGRGYLEERYDRYDKDNPICTANYCYNCGSDMRGDNNG